jgi:hypothetical protein
MHTEKFKYLKIDFIINYIKFFLFYTFQFWISPKIFVCISPSSKRVRPKVLKHFLYVNKCYQKLFDLDLKFLGEKLLFVALLAKFTYICIVYILILLHVLNFYKVSTKLHVNFLCVFLCPCNYTCKFFLCYTFQFWLSPKIFVCFEVFVCISPIVQK